MDDLHRVRMMIEQSITEFEKSNAFMPAFAWPLDSLCCTTSFGYFLHVAFAEAWNASGREESAVVFLRKWMSDDAVLNSALAEWHKWFAQETIDPRSLPLYRSDVRNIQKK